MSYAEIRLPLTARILTKLVSLGYLSPDAEHPADAREAVLAALATLPMPEPRNPNYAAAA